MMPRNKCWFSLIVVAALLCKAPTATAGIMNGEFTTPGVGGDPFDGWTTNTAAFFLPPSDGGDLARFDTVGFLNDIQLEQSFLLPANAISLSFEFLFISAAGGSNDPVAANDLFQATLFDSSFDPINPIFAGFLDGYYSFDSSGFEDIAPTGVTVDSLAGGLRRVTLDLTSVPIQNLTIDFQLLGDDDGLASTVLLDNVVLAVNNTVVPEPSSMAIWVLIGVAASPIIQRRKRKTLQPA